MILKKIKDIINRKINYIVSRQLKSSQTMFSYMQLSKLFHEDLFMPLTSWSISPDLILHVLNDIEINDRKCIVEFGAGASTIYIAKLIKLRHPNTVFYSIESDVSWIEKITEQLKSLKLTDSVTFILAPKQSIPKVISFKDQKLWYNSAILEKNLEYVENIDLILVDGPSGERTPYSRVTAIPFLKNKISDSYSIYLDDTNRAKRGKSQNTGKKN